MRKSTVPVFLFLFAFFLPALAHPADITIVTVGAFDDYPLIFQDSDGKIKGLYVDLLTEIGEKENIIFT